MKSDNNLETYINHPTWGLLYRVCMVEQNQELFTTLYAQRLFFLVTTDPKGLKFQPIGRTEARMLLENRLRSLRRTGSAQEYDQLQNVFKMTFQ
ncbi:MAG: PipX family protein [Calothrix sp. MO_167.B12]|nr:PipX family protein [Calothrix sp. MO_167.B12]